MDEIMERLLQNGFSIAVATFLLVRTDKRIEDLKNAVMHLANVIEQRGGGR